MMHQHCPVLADLVYQVEVLIEYMDLEALAGPMVTSKFLCFDGFSLAFILGWMQANQTIGRAQMQIVPGHCWG